MDQWCSNSVFIIQKDHKSRVVIQTEMEWGPLDLYALLKMGSRRAIARMPPTAIRLQYCNENGQQTRSRVSFGKLQPSQKIRITRPFDWVSLSLLHVIGSLAVIFLKLWLSWRMRQEQNNDTGQSYIRVPQGVPSRLWSLLRPSF